MYRNCECVWSRMTDKYIPASAGKQITWCSLWSTNVLCRLLHFRKLIIRDFRIHRRNLFFHRFPFIGSCAYSHVRINPDNACSMDHRVHLPNRCHNLVPRTLCNPRVVIDFFPNYCKQVYFNAVVMLALRAFLGRSYLEKFRPSALNIWCPSFLKSAARLLFPWKRMGLPFLLEWGRNQLCRTVAFRYRLGSCPSNQAGW